MRRDCQFYHLLFVLIPIIVVLQKFINIGRLLFTSLSKIRRDQKTVIAKNNYSFNLGQLFSSETLENIFTLSFRYAG